MAKKGKLSNVELHYIKTQPNKSVAELAKDLDRTEAVVAKVVDVVREKVVEPVQAAPEPEKPKRESLAQFMIQKTAGKQLKGVTAMTTAASQRADESKAARGAPQPNPDNTYKCQ